MDGWQEMWDGRYAEPGYSYGTEPNEFLREKLAQHRPAGRILLAAEGEGRNAVFCARRGLSVTAFDISESGRDKALALAGEAGVDLDYQVGPLPDLPLVDERFGALGLIYAHFPPSIRSDYHRCLAELLEPGGLVVLEAFAKGHLAYRERNPAVGGPRDEGLLLSAEELTRDFASFEVLELAESAVTLNEGKYHRGEGWVVRFVGRKA